MSTSAIRARAASGRATAPAAGRRPRSSTPASRATRTDARRVISTGLDVDLDHVRRIFDTTLLGMIETTRLALPLLERSRGAIVNITSTVADQPFANTS